MKISDQVDDLVLELGETESYNVASPVNDGQLNTDYSSINNVLVSRRSFTESEFLDLLPANTYFH